MYIYLLQRYLIQKYRYECESTEKCSKILETMEDLEDMTVTQKQLEKQYFHLFTPLMKEVFE